jgi:hypothetical protein
VVISVPRQISRNLLLQTLFNIYSAEPWAFVDGGTRQHSYLGQEIASPGQGEMLMSNLRGGSLEQGPGKC